MFTRRELFGNTKSKSAPLEKLARWNSLNRTGKVNYNEGGTKDNIGLQSVTEKFVDNFLLGVLVADYNTKNGKSIYVGTHNKAIRDLLAAHELEKCEVKAVALKKLMHAPTDAELEKMPMRNRDKKAALYYYQEYNVACPNIPYERVMGFLRSAELASISMVIEDIDITMDYAGSFDKAEVIEHLVANEDFRLQRESNSALRTVVDNDFIVSRNCLTYMEAVKGISMRKRFTTKWSRCSKAKACVVKLDAIGKNGFVSKEPGWRRPAIRQVSVG